ncbi:MFS transporter, FSR family, fosmidomycin resistance protein [Dendrosporobacter quercicolus]|uniref:MFS transporter, FSR family, fosmidomycin resistance protein n=1 Tax=Dendrosporobacter quercicolus TaxID=146817 RepID=A0A1G9RN70_9FIRM|nr:MFS transporter, FSR family, fosmidomycin resistance protein [Dendrosporobacter quercicolus]
MMASSGRQSWFYLLLLTAGHFFSDFYTNFLPALLPAVIASQGLSLTLSGLLVMVFAVTSSMLQPVCGYFMDKGSYAWLLLVTLPVSAVFICSSGLASNTLYLFGTVAVSGIAASLFHPLASSLVGRTVVSGRQGLAMSLFVGGGNLGFAFAPFVIIYVLVHWGIGYLPWLIIPALLLTVALYSSGLYKTDLRVARQRLTEDPPWYKSKNILMLNVVMALRSWPQVAIPTFLPVLLAGQGHPPLLAGHMLTVFLLGGAAGALVGGYSGDKAGHKKCILLSLIFCLPPTYYLLSASTINWLTWLSLALSGALLQSMVPSSIVWAQTILPGNAAMVSGMMLGLTFGLGGAGTAITGAVADYIGLPQALLWTVVPLILAIPLTFGIPDEAPARQSPQTFSVK